MAHSSNSRNEIYTNTDVFLVEDELYELVSSVKQWNLAFIAKFGPIIYLLGVRIQSISRLSGWGGKRLQRD